VSQTGQSPEIEGTSFLQKNRVFVKNGLKIDKNGLFLSFGGPKIDRNFEDFGHFWKSEWDNAVQELRSPEVLSGT
jgi:hypothetical protein